jgi:hypothetical protein
MYISIYIHLLLSCFVYLFLALSFSHMCVCVCVCVSIKYKQTQLVGITLIKHYLVPIKDKSLDISEKVRERNIHLSSGSVDNYLPLPQTFQPSVSGH